MSIVKNGFAAPFVRIYFEDQELSPRINTFKYVYDEEDDDTCTINLSTDRREDPDEKWYQIKAQLKVIWGFIGGSVSEAIKVYIQDITWEFTSSTINATIICTEKAVSMKFVDSNRVFKNKSFIDIAKQVAQEHGLKAYIEVDPGDKIADDVVRLIPSGTESLQAYLTRREKVLNDRIKRGDYKLTLPSESPVLQALGIPDTKLPQYKIPSNVDYSNLFKQKKNTPQANKTDAQFLAELARRQQSAYMVETRGDDLIIKKRNFNQRPLKSYVYGDNSGELQSFKPETKNRGRKGNSINNAFGSWDPLTKTYTSGDANVDTSVKSPMLSNFLEQLRFYKTAEKFPNGSYLGAGFTQSKLKHAFISKSNIRSKGDNTLDYRIMDGKVPINVNNRIVALEKAIAGANEIIKNYNSNIYNSLLNNPEEALNSAHNIGESSRLKKNPATATVWGEPLLKVGRIITILGVAKKYSSNYYLVKVSHEIDFNRGYMVDLDMVRQGENIKVNDDYIKNSQINVEVNTKIGTNNPVKNKSLKVKTNG